MKDPDIRVLFPRLVEEPVAASSSQKNHPLAQEFCTNEITTSHYTPSNFLVKNLWQQFQRAANVYFLVIGCLQLDVFFPGLSPTHWSTTIGPLLIVLAINAAKEMGDDFGRHKSDAAVNKRGVEVVTRADSSRGGVVRSVAPCHSPESFKNSRLTTTTTTWRELRVGDLVVVNSGAEIPADLLLLASSDPANVAYVETANLDGETNLKVKSSPGVLVNTCNGRNGACDGLQNGSCNGSCHGSLPSPETIEQSLKNARVECETPNNQLYKFDGKWITGGVAGVETAKTTPPTERTETNNAQDSFHDCSSEANVTPLSVDNVLLRGSTLRNTRWALGLVVFTGGDSKLMKNATSAPTKKSRLETHMNLLVLSVGVFQTVVGLALAGLQREWVLGENPEVASAGDGSSTQRMRHWYLSPSNVWPDMEGANAGTFFTQFVRFIVLLNALIPISLYVTLELVKVVQCAWISFDKELYCAQYDQRCGVRTTTLNEELGAVQCVLSDKTGTLTKNVMAFVKCSIAGVVYEADTLIDFDPGSNQGRRDDGKTTSNHVSNDSSDYLVDGTTSVQIELRDATEHETNKKSYGQTVTDVATATHTVASSKKLRSALVAGNKDVTQFLNHLSTCHTVVPEALSSREGDASDSTNVDASDDGSQTARFGGFKYQASSPDEEALVTGAALLGQRVVSNVNGDIVISRNAPTGCALGGVDTDVFFDPSASTNKSVAVATRVSEPFVDASSGFGSSEHAAPRRSRFSAAKEKLPHADDTGIDRVTVLAVNEFSSARKRMSIVVRDLRYPEGQQIRLRLKGADAAVLERCALPPCERSAKIDSLTRTHLDLFATEGLRTLVLAEKVLSDDEFRTWMGAYASASASLVDREEKLSQVAELIETNCQLVGVTAVEDKLADGVPETISLLRQAGMLVWMLTGDKLETAVSIAHTCKLIDKEGDLVVVREIDFEKDGNFLQTKAFEAKEDAALGSSFGLVIEGGALQYALDTKNIRDFMTLCDACSGGVVCCRVSPIQKASVAEAMKKHRSQVVLGIGDGANDVGLIKAAHVGIGISGREGRAAVMASDFAIGSFSSLARLLLIHGRFSAKRNREVVLYAFFKNFCYATANVWFAFYSAHSSQAQFPTAAIATFNVLWTSLPTIAHACFDQDVESAEVMRNPRLYLETSGPSKASGKDFARGAVGWLLSAAWSSVWCYFAVFVSLAERGSVGESTAGGSTDGKVTADIMSIGLAVFTAVVLTCDAKIAQRTNHWTIVNAVCLLGSVLLWFPFVVLLGSSWQSFGVFPDAASAHSVLFKSNRFWLALLLAVGGCVVPDLVVDSFRRVIKPSLGEVLREREAIEKLKKTMADFDDNDDDGARQKQSSSPSLNAIRFASRSFRRALYQLAPSVSRKNGGLPTNKTGGRRSLPRLWPESCKRRKSRNPSVLEVVREHRNFSEDWNP